MDAQLFPRRLDDPPQFFFWDADTASAVILVVVLGALVGTPLAGALAGLLVARGLARLKEAGGAHVLLNALYWHTPSRWWCPVRAPSHVREWLG
ncbi:MAG TPA: type IV conjugative transfer system protein TraL [Chromatiales bacterium]|nr:type IV conjugative transfer system protein TraL [Chromatiales bacterium]